MSLKKKIILDCDPGIDDALALMLAHGDPTIELLAVTTVAGNQVLEKVTQNALSLAEFLCIKDVPIAAGSASALLKQPQTAGHIHGETGLGDVVLPKPEHVRLDDRHAVLVIIQTIMAHAPQSVTLVPTGALTNIALAVKLEPRIVARVKEVVLMGGTAQIGNSTAVTEFNIDTDPEAAHIVFSQPWKVTMIGLDLTSQAQATDRVMERIASVGTDVSAVSLRLIQFYTEMYRVEGKLPWCLVHDVCAVACVINPDLIESQRAPIHVELRGEHTYGMTVCDLRPKVAETKCNTYVALKLDVDGFWSLFIDALKRIGEPKW